MTQTAARQPKPSEPLFPNPMKEMIAIMNTKQDDRKEPYSPRHTSRLRSIPGFPGLRANASGWILRKRDGHRLKPRIVGGVLCVDVSTPTQRAKPWVPVAVMIARAFVPVPRPRYQHREVVHLDGDLRNCRAMNLAWKRDARSKGAPRRSSDH